MPATGGQTDGEKIALSACWRAIMKTNCCSISPVLLARDAFANEDQRSSLERHGLLNTERVWRHVCFLLFRCGTAGVRRDAQQSIGPNSWLFSARRSDSLRRLCLRCNRRKNTVAHAITWIPRARPQQRMARTGLENRRFSSAGSAVGIEMPSRAERVPRLKGTSSPRQHSTAVADSTRAGARLLCSILHSARPRTALVIQRRSPSEASCRRLYGPAACPYTVH